MNAIVTGAASGIGCQVVTLLARVGNAITASDIDFERLQRAAATHAWPAHLVVLERHDVACDRAWSDVIARAVERWGTIDALVNVAGILRVEPVHKLDPLSVARQLDVNTKGVILGTQAAAAVMVRQGRGKIVNMASMAALAPVPGISVYSASKFAVRGFSLAAAVELEPLGVQVSVVCPDAVDTPMVDYQLDHAGAALTFSGPRLLSVDEVARAIVRMLEGRWQIELVMPRSRGLLAKVSTLLPRSVHRWITRRLTDKGLARQLALRQQRCEGRDEKPKVGRSAS